MFDRKEESATGNDEVTETVIFVAVMVADDGNGCSRVGDDFDCASRTSRKDTINGFFVPTSETSKPITVFGRESQFILFFASTNKFQKRTVQDKNIDIGSINSEKKGLIHQ